jgi:putative ABC transport system permease protein
VPGVARAVGDTSFPVAVFDSAGRSFGDNTRGHGWSSAALTPYHLSQGAPPLGPGDVVLGRSIAAARGLAPGDRVRINTPSGPRTFRVSGIASGASEDEQPVFFADTGRPDPRRRSWPGQCRGDLKRPGVDPSQLRAALGERLGGSVGGLDHAHAANADPGDQEVSGHATLLGLLGSMAGIAAVVAVFVIASTFAFAVAQRRRENAALRALGATPGQVRRLVIGEAMLIGLVDGAVGLVVGLPLANEIARLLVRHLTAAQGFAPDVTLAVLLLALAGGPLGCLVAVLGAAWRAGAVPPAEALREQRAGRQRLGVVRTIVGLTMIGCGVAMVLVFHGTSALAFAFFTSLWFMCGIALLAPLTLGGLSALLARPLRLLPGALGLLASTALSASRSRAGAIGVPVMLITALVGTNVLVAQTDQRNTRHVTAQRTTAPQVLVASASGGLAPGTVAAIRALPGVHGATAELPTQIFLLDRGLTNNGEPRPAAGLDGGRAGQTPGLDLGVRSGSLDLS